MKLDYKAISKGMRESNAHYKDLYAKANKGLRACLNLLRYFAGLHSDTCRIYVRKKLLMKRKPHYTVHLVNNDRVFDNTFTYMPPRSSSLVEFNCGKAMKTGLYTMSVVMSSWTSDLIKEYPTDEAIAIAEKEGLLQRLMEQVGLMKQTIEIINRSNWSMGNMVSFIASLSDGLFPITFALQDNVNDPDSLLTFLVFVTPESFKLIAGYKNSEITDLLRNHAKLCFTYVICNQGSGCIGGVLPLFVTPELFSDVKSGSSMSVYNFVMNQRTELIQMEEWADNQ